MPDQDISKKVAQYFAQYPLRSYLKGQILIHAGDRPEHIIYVCEGKIRQYDITYRGDEVVVNVFKSGAFLPMLWALTDAPNRYFFDAETAVEVRVAPREEVVDFLQQNPDVTYDLLSRVYTGVYGLMQRMVQLMSGGARSRLMYEILVECKRFGKPQGDNGQFIAITEGDLAARAGLTRETVSREVKKLSRLGLVSLGHKGLVVHNLKTFEEEIHS
jgi:CRP/FNR family cyclic AMP-dependent transcriptional regulator